MADSLPFHPFIQAGFYTLVRIYRGGFGVTGGHTFHAVASTGVPTTMILSAMTEGLQLPAAGGMTCPVAGIAVEVWRPQVVQMQRIVVLRLVT